MKALTRKVHESPDSPFNAIAVGCALMGLRSMSAERREVQDLLVALLEKIEPCHDNFNDISLTSSFNGLRSMSDALPSSTSSSTSSNGGYLVRRLLAKLAALLESSSLEGLSPQAVSHILAGFKSMSGKSRELRAAMAVVAFKMLREVSVARHKGFSSFDVGMALGGLQSIDSRSCPEVLIVLDKIAQRLSAPSEEPLRLQTRHAAFALYGLKSLSGEDLPEVRAILAILAREIAAGCREPFNPQLLSMAFLGLKGASSRLPEVCGVLTALTAKLEEMEAPLDSQAVGNIIFSLQGMKADQVAVRAFLKVMASAMIK